MSRLRTAVFVELVAIAMLVVGGIYVLGLTGQPH